MSGLIDLPHLTGYEFELIDKCEKQMKLGNDSLIQECSKSDKLMYHLANRLYITGALLYSFNVAKQGYELGFPHCTAFLGHFYLIHTTNMLLGLRLIIQSKKIQTMRSRLHKSFIKSDIERYVYGEHFLDICCWCEWDILNIEKLQHCRDFYIILSCKVRRTTLFTFWFLTLQKLCSKDVAKLIAKLIWESRYEIVIWK